MLCLYIVVGFVLRYVMYCGGLYCVMFMYCGRFRIVLCLCIVEVCIVLCSCIVVGFVLCYVYVLW